MIEMTPELKEVIERSAVEAENDLVIGTVMNQYLAAFDILAEKETRLSPSVEDHAWRCEKLGIPNTYVQLPPAPHLRSLKEILDEYEARNG